MGFIAHRASKGFAFAFLTTLAAAVPARGAVYTILDLGTLGGTVSQTHGQNVLNASGQVVGQSTPTGDLTFHAFRTAANGAIIQGAGGSDLGTLGGTTSVATGINASGQTVGDSLTNGDAAAHAFRTAANGAIVQGPGGSDLGTLGGATSQAYGINDSGQVAGYSDIAGNFRHAFRTVANGAIVQGLGGSDLGTLGGSSSVAYGINASGQTVGVATTIGGAFQAFRTAPNRPIVQGVGGSGLGSLGGTSSCAYGINASGQVVGYANLTGDAAFSAFFVDVTGPMVDLNTLIDPASGWVLTEAHGINDLGQIAGTGTINGQSHAFLLTPTPEPSSLLLLALSAMALVRRHRRL